MRCSAADSHLKLLGRVVSCAGFFNWLRFRIQPCSTTICSSVEHAVLCSSVVYAMLCSSVVYAMLCSSVVYAIAMSITLSLPLWLLIGTYLRLLAVELLSTAEPLCPSRCLFGTILVTLFDGVGLAGF